LLEHCELAIYLDRVFYFNQSIYLSALFLSYVNINSFMVFEYLFELFFSLVVAFYFFLVIKFFLYTYGFSYSNNDSTLDLDHATGAALVEIEKEIAAIDDLLAACVLLIFIFGLYFAAYGIVEVLTAVNNFCFLYFILPLLFYFIFLAPLCLLFDFGFLCFMYLRGTGPTLLLVAELMYDLVNLFAFYIRVFVQLSRILLMVVAAGSLQEFIFNFSIDQRFFLLNESFFENIYNLEFNFKSITYFLLVKFPMFLIY
jgi:hypothetical protein